MYVTPKDSRQRYTKHCLFDSFIKAMKSKPVQDITVCEISTDAGVSRKTFYKYYSDQFGLLKAMEDDLFAGFKEQLAELPANVFEIAPVLIRFSQQHHVLVRAAFENRGEGSFIDRVIDYLYQQYYADWQKANPSMSDDDVDFLFHYVTSGLIGIIRYWLVQVPKMPIKNVIEKADFLMRLSTPK
jgi:AcrR family transcriptional regulator